MGDAEDAGADAEADGGAVGAAEDTRDAGEVVKGVEDAEDDVGDAEGRRQRGAAAEAATEADEVAGSQQSDESTGGSGDGHMRNAQVRYALGDELDRNELVPDKGGGKAPAKSAKRAPPPERGDAEGDEGTAEAAEDGEEGRGPMGDAKDAEADAEREGGAVGAAENTSNAGEVVRCVEDAEDDVGGAATGVPQMRRAWLATATRAVHRRRPSRGPRRRLGTVKTKLTEMIRRWAVPALAQGKVDQDLVDVVGGREAVDGEALVTPQPAEVNDVRVLRLGSGLAATQDGADGK